MEKTTIHDVAERAGVSVTTVSRVLNNRGYISDEMRSKVGKAIEELNYTPNHLARSFYNNKTMSIGLIIPTINNPFFGELAFYIEKELANKNYNLYICNSLNDLNNELKYLKLLKEKKVDGLIVGSHNIARSEYDKVENKVVSIERAINNNIPIIQSDNYSGGKLATEELINNGCKNILCIAGNKILDMPANNRADAYKEIMERENLDVKIKEIPFNLSINEKKSIVEEILKKSCYDGIFAGDDLMAGLVMAEAANLGINVPTDLKVIGFDGSNIFRIISPHISTIQQPIEKLSKTAVSVILDLIDNKLVEQKYVHSVKLIASNSTSSD